MHQHPFLKLYFSRLKSLVEVAVEVDITGSSNFDPLRPNVLKRHQSVASHTGFAVLEHDSLDVHG